MCPAHMEERAKNLKTISIPMAKLQYFLNLFVSTPLVFMSLFNIKQPPPPAMFIFGDSGFDAGNNNYINTTTVASQANFWPYGESYFIYPTGRFSNGRLIPDFIAEHAKLPLIPAYLEPTRNYSLKNYQGVNFASGGAGVLSETNAHLAIIDLRTQLKYYKRELAELAERKGHAEAARISSNAVYFFSIGGNDYKAPYDANSTIPYPQYSKFVEMVIGNLSTILEEMYKSGGRKFVFVNLSDMGCLPGTRILKPETDVDECYKEVSDISELHNKALNKMLSKMEHQLHGFKYFVYDFRSNLAERMNYPLKYGYIEGKTACCGSGKFNGVYSCGRTKLYNYFNLCERPSEFVFWDANHLTQRVYKEMADEMWSTPTLKRFFLCF